ncbi:hypothetical protein D3C71_1882900 [compost metagenome]
MEWIIPYRKPQLKPFRLEVLTVVGDIGRGMRNRSGKGFTADEISRLTKCPD